MSVLPVLNVTLNIWGVIELVAGNGMVINSHHGGGGPLKIMVCVVSSSRFQRWGKCTSPPEDDVSGKAALELLEAAGHTVQYVLCPDGISPTREIVEDFLRGESSVLIMCGGTGLAPSDLTIEAVEPMYHKSIMGFGELFRSLSYEEIGSSAMLSRASAGLIDNKVVFCTPGSPKAISLAIEKLILPQIHHILRHASGKA